MDGTNAGDRRKGNPADEAIALGLWTYLQHLSAEICAQNEKLYISIPSSNLTSEVAKRLEIEIRTEEMEHQFKRCVEVTEWKLQELHPDLAKLCA